LVLRVHIDVPPGYALNDAVPIRYRVEAMDGNGVVHREALGEVHEFAGTVDKFEIVLPLRARQGEDLLRLSLAYSICRPSAAEVAKLRGVVWDIPLRLSPVASVDHVALKTPHAP
jgi:hypothetical protein